MSDEAINAMLNEASAETTPVENAAEPKTAAETEKPEGDTGSEQTKENFRTPWPKSAIDVMNRKDKKIVAAQKRIEEFEKQINDAAFLKERIKSFEPAPDTNSNDPAPDISKYDDWVKYNRDLTAWNLRQLQNAQSAPKGNEPAKVDPQKAAWQQQRLQNTTEKTRELLTTHPEYLPVFQQNADLLDDLPEATKDILLATDNPALAVLQLAHDGTLNDLPYMAAPLAQKVILKALADSGALLGATSQEDGEQQATTNPVSRAPAPMKESKTSKSGAKDPKNMSDDEFRSAFL